MTTNDAPIQPTEAANLERYREWASTKLTEAPVTSVVIPTYNEEWRVVPTIGAVAFAMSQRGEAWELIISDDGSTDKTKELVEDINLPNLRFLDSANTGKGGAVRRGVKQAKGNYVLFIDADQSTPIEQFESLLAPILDNEAHITIGSRSASGADVANKSTARKIFSWVLNKIVRFGFGLPYQDTQCGFKLFTAEAANELFTAQRIDGFSFDLELLYLARRFGYQVAEVPVEWFDAPGSTVDPVKVAMTFGQDLLRIRWWSIRGKYNQRPGMNSSG